MSVTIKWGWTKWSLLTDDDGHREYTIKFLAVSDRERPLALDGPARVYMAPGMPTVGARWNYGRDFDLWAFCTPYVKITAHEHKLGEPTKFWTIERKFSTRPFRKCQDTEIKDPLLEPPKLSGSFVNQTEEATIDRYGDQIRTSSWETFRGSQIEYDVAYPTVHIEMNVEFLDLELLSTAINKVNDTPLWGLGTRRIKLSTASWERKVYGRCGYYFTYVFDFDINFNTFDRYLLDEGDKVLNGHWDGDDWLLDDMNSTTPNRNNPKHFIRAVDQQGNPMHTLLSNGRPLGQTASASYVKVEKHDEYDFKQLGVPLNFQPT